MRNVHRKSANHDHVLCLPTSRNHNQNFAYGIHHGYDPACAHTLRNAASSSADHDHDPAFARTPYNAPRNSANHDRDLALVHDLNITTSQSSANHDHAPVFTHVPRSTKGVAQIMVMVLRVPMSCPKQPGVQLSTILILRLPTSCAAPPQPSKSWS